MFLKAAPGPPTGVPGFRVQPQGVTVTSGNAVSLWYGASWEPVPTLVRLHVGQPCRPAGSSRPCRVGACGRSRWRLGTWAHVKCYSQPPGHSWL